MSEQQQRDGYRRVARALREASEQPLALPAPENMTEALVAKSHAVDQLAAIDAELKRLRALRRDWNKRLGECLRGIGKFAR